MTVLLPAEVQGWAEGAVAAWLRANRGREDAELAGALSNLGVRYSEVGHRAGALPGQNSPHRSTGCLAPHVRS